MPCFGIRGNFKERSIILVEMKNKLVIISHALRNAFPMGELFLTFAFVVSPAGSCLSKNILFFSLGLTLPRDTRIEVNFATPHGSMNEFSK